MSAGPQHIAILLLAAGASARLGRPKQLVRYRGETLVRRAARIAVESGLGAVIAVVANDDALIRAELKGLAGRIVINPCAERGMGSSIKAGLVRVDSSVDAVLVLVCDQIALSAQLLHSLAGALATPDAAAAACSYGGAVGVPAIFKRALFEDLAQIPDSGGAKRLLASLGDRLRTIEFPQGNQDIDTPEDLEKLG